MIPQMRGQGLSQAEQEPTLGMHFHGKKLRSWVSPGFHPEPVTHQCVCPDQASVFLASSVSASTSRARSGTCFSVGRNQTCLPLYCNEQ